MEVYETKNRCPPRYGRGVEYVSCALLKRHAWNSTKSYSKILMMADDIHSSSLWDFTVYKLFFVEFHACRSHSGIETASIQQEYDKTPCITSGYVSFLLWERHAKLAEFYSKILCKLNFQIEKWNFERFKRPDSNLAYRLFVRCFWSWCTLIFPHFSSKATRPGPARPHNSQTPGFSLFVSEFAAKTPLYIRSGDNNN